MTSKYDSFPGVTATQLADTMTNTGQYILNDFLNAGEIGSPEVIHPVYIGKPLGLLAMRYGFSLSRDQARDLILFNQESPTRATDKKGVPYPTPFMQDVEIRVAPPIPDDDDPLHDIEPAFDVMTPLKAGEHIEVPRDYTDVTFRGMIMEKGNPAFRERTANNHKDPRYSQKIYMAAATGLLGVAVQHSPNFSRILETYENITGPQSVEGKPITMYRAVLPDISVRTPLNGAESVLDEAVQRGLYGVEYQSHRTFYKAYQSRADQVLLENSARLDRLTNLHAPAIILETIEERVVAAKKALEAVSTYF